MNFKKIANTFLMSFLCLSIFLCVSCSRKEEKPAAGEDNGDAAYFPLQVGDQWLYRRSITPDSPDFKVKVAGREKFEEEDCYILESYVSNDLMAQEFITLKPDKGFYTRKLERYYPKKATLIPEINSARLLFPIKEGTWWEWKTPEGQGSVTFKITGFEEVKVPAGEFQCACLETIFKIPDGTVVTDKNWYAKGIGLVKNHKKITPGDSSQAPPPEMIVELVAFISVDGKTVGKMPEQGKQEEPKKEEPPKENPVDSDAP